MIDTHCHIFHEYYDNIDEVINKRYNSYSTNCCKLDYVVFIPHSNYGIQINLLTGKKYIYEY